MGWTPLHLACYFGHAVVVEDLLKVFSTCPCVRQKILCYARSGIIQVSLIEGRQLHREAEPLLQFICT